MSLIKKYLLGRLSFHGVVSVALWFLLLCTIISFLDTTHFLLDLFSHFKIQYLVLSLIASFFFVILKQYLHVILAVVVVFANSISIVPFYFSSEKSIPAFDQHKLRFLLSNVLTSNARKGSLIDLIKKENPDVIVLLEIDEEWAKRLNVLGDSYAENFYKLRNDNFGIGIISKYPFVNPSIQEWGSTGIPSIEVKLRIDSEILNVIATHPPPPIGKVSSALRNSQLQDIASHVKEMSGDTILLGDLNITMWSRVLQSFEKQSGLINSRRGFGVLPTWPTLFPLMMIPIDHCFVSKHINVKDMRLGKNIGSDHLPLIVDIEFGGDSPRNIY